MTDDSEASVQPPPRPAPAAYEPPRILWEEEFHALAQIVSNPPCIPFMDPHCSP